MFVLVVSALLSGQPTMATREFGERAACEATGAMVVRQLIAEHADHIIARCYEEYAT